MYLISRGWIFKCEIDVYDPSGDAVVTGLMKGSMEIEGVLAVTYLNSGSMRVITVMVQLC